MLKNNNDFLIPEQQRLYLPHSTLCFVCGSINPVGLKCKFFTNEKGDVFLDSKINSPFAGYENIIHGGIQASILDEGMGWCAITQTQSEIFYFTRNLNVTYRKPVVANTQIIMQAQLVEQKKNMIFVKGKIMDTDGKTLTSAEASYIVVPEERMKNTIQHMIFINDGRKYLPKAMKICQPKPFEPNDEIPSAQM